jgi:steroid 5-alpha reductase family enzyme
MPDAAALLRPALLGLAAMGALAAATWVISSLRRNVAYVDRVWSLLFVSAALVYAQALPATGPRSAWVLGLVLAWGLRLSAHITWRGWGHDEDRRYQAIRARNQPHFAFKSLFIVFGLQVLLGWLVSTPLLAALASPRPLNLADAAGLALCAFGIAFEAVADWQLARFQRDASLRGRVMETGLWRYSRHPNYFGECCAWWGFFLLALGAGAPWTVVSPLLMTWLLLKVSGVALLEKDIAERRPGYRDYVRRTSAFIPRPPRPAHDKA